MREKENVSLLRKKISPEKIYVPSSYNTITYERITRTLIEMNIDRIYYILCNLILRICGSHIKNLLDILSLQYCIRKCKNIVLYVYNINLFKILYIYTDFIKFHI